MAEGGGLAMEPIGEGKKDDAPPASPKPAAASAKMDENAKKPLSPEEYWKRKAAKYGWKLNTGNYARDHLVSFKT